jgi:hypothetical protein
MLRHRQECPPCSIASSRKKPASALSFCRLQAERNADWRTAVNLTTWLKNRRIAMLRRHLVKAKAQLAELRRIEEATDSCYPIASRNTAGYIAEVRETLRQLGVETHDV